ncbi:MAG TPA: MarR family transcriptional regulator [Gaiellaceae bacterium]|nr:MarR family transcriptional regulator [Gaiellaceae bacterium]
MTTASAPAPDLVKSPRLPHELLKSNLFLLKRLGDLVKERAVAEFLAAGCNPYQHAVLALLDEGARDTQAQIADALGFDRSQLVGILDGLEEQGLVERKRDPNDRRRHVVKMTADGKRTLARRRAILERIENDFFEPLDPESRRTLHELLLSLAAHHDARYASNESA